MVGKSRFFVYFADGDEWMEGADWFREARDLSLTGRVIVFLTNPRKKREFIDMDAGQRREREGEVSGRRRAGA